jgi:prephenate dehydratase
MLPGFWIRLPTELQLHEKSTFRGGVLGTEKFSHIQSVAIQGERGSNSHMAALEMLGAVDLVPCSLSADVFDRLLEGSVDAAVLPIENSLHGSVAEHYDLLLEHPVRITAESLLRIRFHLMAMPGVALGDLRRVLSHPVALAQCRRFLAQHRELEAVPFYDTAGSVKHLMEAQLRDVAGIAPELAARQYGAQILLRDLEDHAENFTRFHLLRLAAAEPSERPEPSEGPETTGAEAAPCNKMSVAFAIDHRPGTLVAALQLLAGAGIDLTKIESRPVPGRPWEYVFYVDLRFDSAARADAALAALRAHCRMVKELGRYRAA